MKDTIFILKENHSLIDNDNHEQCRRMPRYCCFQLHKVSGKDCDNKTLTYTEELCCKSKKQKSFDCHLINCYNNR